MKGWKSLLFTALSVFFVWLFLRRVDFAGIRAVWGSIHWSYPLSFLLLMLPQYALRAVRWGVLLSPFKRGVPFRSLWNFSLIGFMISYLLPGRLGEIARPVLLAEKEEMRKSQAIATIVNERLFDLLTVLVLFTLYLAVARDAASPVLLQLRTASLLLLPLVILIFFFILLANHTRVFPWTERLVRGLFQLLPRRWRERSVGFALHFIRALRLDLGGRGMTAVALLSLLHWALIIFSYWLLLRGFGIHPGLMPVIPFTVVIFVSAAVPTPGMAGSLDLAATYALAGLFAVPEETAVAFTILFHFLILAIPIALGLAAFWHEGLSIRSLGRLRRKDELPVLR